MQFEFVDSPESMRGANVSSINIPFYLIISDVNFLPIAETYHHSVTPFGDIFVQVLDGLDAVDYFYVDVGVVL